MVVGQVKWLIPRSNAVRNKGALCVDRGAVAKVAPQAQ